MTNAAGTTKYAEYSNGGSLKEMNELSTSELSDYDVVGNAGDFVVARSLDLTEIRLLDFFSGTMHPLRIDITDEEKARRLNFALSRVAGAVEKYRLIVCTYDAKWNNACKMYPISVLPV